MSIISTKSAKKGKKAKKKLTNEQKEQRAQVNEISTIFKNIGLTKVGGIDGKEFIYDGRRTEMDDIFCFENIIIITEYTIGAPGKHLLNKKIFYDKVLHDPRAFLDFLISEPKLNTFNKFYSEQIKSKYSLNQLRLRILYCSKQDIKQEHKDLVDIIYFDFHILKYFQSLTKVIKKTSKYEFLEFIKVPFSEFSDNIKNSSIKSINTFSGHILPEEKSSFKDGYKIVSFYIDAESLLKRAYVLRQNGWKDIENIGHYQRMLLPKKIASMRKYLSEKDRVFINNIISSISIDKIKLYDKENNRLEIDNSGNFKHNNTSNVIPTLIEIEDECNIIGIIDGQHRTFAYHEGDDQYERKISEQRKVQNLLVTGVLFPSRESEIKRMQFEANLFLEINSNQANASSQIKQEIELMISPFSSVAISKKVLSGLNKEEPLRNLIEQYWYESGKIKTASIVSYGLKPLTKIDDTKSKDSLYGIWSNENKQKLKDKNSEDFELLKDYIDYCVEKINELLIAFKYLITDNQWRTYNPSNPDGILTVTFINGVLNVLRLLIENGKVSNIDDYRAKLRGIGTFEFKEYKSSQYRKMGEDIYRKYFSDEGIEK